jgi:hypothetical protein
MTLNPRIALNRSSGGRRVRPAYRSDAAGRFLVRLVTKTRGIPAHGLYASSR